MRRASEETGSGAAAPADGGTEPWFGTVAAAAAAAGGGPAASFSAVVVAGGGAGGGAEDEGGVAAAAMVCMAQTESVSCGLWVGRPRRRGEKSTTRDEGRRTSRQTGKDGGARARQMGLFPDEQTRGGPPTRSLRTHIHLACLRTLARIYSGQVAAVRVFVSVGWEMTCNTTRPGGGGEKQAEKDPPVERRLWAAGTWGRHPRGW